MICAAEQNGIGVLLPSIARDLDAQATITWAGTSALIANTVFQVLYGRLSDLFGRKKIMLSALILLALCDLACGLSVNSTMLYIFRGLAGVANGGITSLSMMIVSDIVTLQERGKYQGILGVMVGMGNAFGMTIFALFAQDCSADELSRPTHRRCLRTQPYLERTFLPDLTFHSVRRLC
jgi:MFS family permease